MQVLVGLAFIKTIDSSEHSDQEKNLLTDLWTILGGEDLVKGNNVLTLISGIMNI